MVHKTLALKVQGLTVHYQSTPVLWDIDLAIPQGQLVGIIGPNGAGKSTFMKAILGLVRPTSGAVWMLGKEVKKVCKKIAYVPQKEAVDWDFPITVKELVLMGSFPKLGMFRLVGKKEHAKAMTYLEMVGMSDLCDRQISQLSGGQQQRAFLARALLQEADIYFLDEPLAGVDHASEEIIMELLKALRQEGKTAFLVHHDLNSVEKYFDSVILLNVRLIATGKTSEVFTKNNIRQAYGKSFALLDETLRLSQHKAAGVL
ncbi:MAG: metal ABC transporter ATP-binding protein [Verrucomicrobia bacterium]|nr:metal ABC transporter ATP-binding protein [Verrucomicrobiota bacterium]